MMKRKNVTRKALLTSIMALLLCISMLVGTTFAWFTDSVTSGNNKIVAGNLDIDVLYANDPNGTYETIENKEDLFVTPAGVTKGLWEPGHTEVAYLKVVNNGSLALKYQFKVDSASEVIGKSVLGNDIKLSEILKFAATAPSTSAPAAYTRETAQAAAEASSAALLGYATEAIKLAPGEEQYIALVVYMPETVGNEANYRGTDIPTITFKLTALATQVEAETDSFDNKYDENLWSDVVQSPYEGVSTAAELVSAMASVEPIAIRLDSDITLTERLNVNKGANVHLNLNGKTITVSDTNADPAFYTYKNSTLTIDGDGTVVLEKPSMSLLFPGGDVVIENGTFIKKVPAGTPADQVGALVVGAKVSPWGSQTVTINGGYFDGGYYDANAADIDEILAGTKTLEETADDIAKRGNSADKNAVRVAIKNNVQLTMNLSYNLVKIYGGTFVGMNPAWGDEGCMLPTTPTYLRPWSYYQGALLDGQEFHEDGIVLPDGYTITKGATSDGRPTYTVEYNK